MAMNSKDRKMLAHKLDEELSVIEIELKDLFDGNIGQAYKKMKKVPYKNLVEIRKKIQLINRTKKEIEKYFSTEEDETSYNYIQDNLDNKELMVLK